MQQLFFVFLCVLSLGLTAQSSAPNNWWELDQTENSFPGVSAARANAYLAGKKAEPVVVAVIDSGVDIEHEDLKDVIWTNPGEIPGNGIDDDRNGYVDDVHGWNFIGGADGRNVNYENLEVVRLYNRLHAKYNNRNREGLSKKEKAEFDAYQSYKETIEKKQKELGPTAAQYEMIKAAIDQALEELNKEPEDVTAEDIAGIDSDDQTIAIVKQVVANATAGGTTFAELYGQLEGAQEYFDSQLKYNYNPEFDAREIVGDDPANFDQRNYGNNDVEGPDAAHGTHVAGIIAGVRDNDLGINGVGGDHVRIMSVRTVPNGDERDKDVANAIRYAVDNGAKVINMSFGKGQSPYKKEVDAAMKYAEKNDVLLVHAAGNDGKMLTLENNYPNDTYQGRRKTGKTWIEVGAASSNYNDQLAAGFSNYNKKYVDVFAPGAQIYSTIPGDEYAKFDGTSMAAPMVAGIAALLRSYFPDLSARQVKEIIEESALPVNLNVIKPGTDDETVKFAELSATGGLANAYTAVKLAERTKGKIRRQRDNRDESLRQY
ncbi:subtilisin family serine protease [Lewinella marina]|uniref:Peptidase S8 n=1 Tax=Neolewinella marina TaxID=438751 RepID=A0A2G0CFC7_9BACT|nr:S8 family peptidase [Neolewinella marina]NJB85637.1 subtilisin family serine protease [Neolewinella marina]PHK98678.1 peptidase S8 [Neolewinella marina]